MQYGLRCGPRDKKRLYAVKTRKAAFAGEAEQQTLKLKVPDLDGAVLYKDFKVFIGIGTKQLWDRPKKLGRAKKLFAFDDGTFQPLWIEYVPVEDAKGEVASFKPTTVSTQILGRGDDKRHMKRWKGKEDRAATLIYQVEGDKVKGEKRKESTPNSWKDSQKRRKQSYDEKEATEWTSSSARSSNDHDWAAEDWKTDWKAQDYWSKDEPEKKDRSDKKRKTDHEDAPWRKPKTPADRREDGREKRKDDRPIGAGAKSSKSASRSWKEDDTWHPSSSWKEDWPEDRDDYRDAGASSSSSSWNPGHSRSREGHGVWSSMWSTN